jgi:hypothetical protein
MLSPIMMMAPADGENGSKGAEKRGPKPRARYWHFWTDENGVSHQKQCALTQFELKGVGGAEPQWNDKHEKLESTVVVTVQPIGLVGDWHEIPLPSGSSCYLVAGGSKAWMALVSSKAPESSPSVKIRGAPKARKAAKDIAPARSEITVPC